MGNIHKLLLCASITLSAANRNYIGSSTAAYDAPCPSLPDPQAWSHVDLDSELLVQALKEVDELFATTVTQEKFPGMIATVVFGDRVVSLPRLLLCAQKTTKMRIRVL